MANLQVSSNNRDGAMIVTMDGAASVDQVDAMQRQFMRITAQHPQLVIIDMSRLSFIASLGMGTLVSLHRDIGKTGGTMKLAGVNELVMEALKRARLHDLLAICDSVDAALA